MKVKNLTLGQLKEICETHEKCRECPLNGSGVCSLAVPLLDDKDLETREIIFQVPRRYYIRFTKYDIYRGNNSKEMRYQNNCGFCVNDLNSYSIKRPFDNENTVVENLMVKDLQTKKVIYQGKDYNEFKEKCL